MNMLVCTRCRVMYLYILMWVSIIYLQQQNDNKSVVNILFQLNEGSALRFCVARMELGGLSIFSCSNLTFCCCFRTDVNCLYNYMIY